MTQTNFFAILRFTLLPELNNLVFQGQYVVVAAFALEHGHRLRQQQQQGRQHNKGWLRNRVELTRI